MLRYAHAFFNQVAQSGACNQFHSLQQRCCRWLLMTHDLMQSDEFLLTQEFLAMMVGVQRTGVSAAAGGLQRAGLIRYKCGNVTIRPSLPPSHWVSTWLSSETAMAGLNTRTRCLTIFQLSREPFSKPSLKSAAIC
jgi:hypothetical protein